MTNTFKLSRLAMLSIAAFCFGVAITPAVHAESFTSSALSTGSMAVGSLSDSLQTSSGSSSGPGKVADGDYRVLNVAQLPDKPGVLRVRLQPQAAADKPGTSADEGLLLDVPQHALGDKGLATGEVVSVRNRSYGLEFARAQTRTPFFLVLADAWFQELEARPLRF